MYIPFRQVTLQCVDDFNLHEQSYVIDFDTWSRTAVDLIRKHKYVKFWMDAKTGSAVVYHADTSKVRNLFCVGNFVRDPTTNYISIDTTRKRCVRMRRE